MLLILRIMTKQEKIKLEYENIGAQNLYPREDGWSVIHDNSVYNEDMVDIIYETCTDLRPNDSIRDILRPKSLQGIEDNNGWIKIESEDDLPKDFCACWCVVDEVVINTPLQYIPITKEFNNNQIFQDYKWFSHYKIIEKPKPPIY